MITFPPKVTISHQLVNIFNKKKFTQKYVDLCAWLSIAASRIYALFVVKSTSVLKLGGGGQSNFDNAKILTAPITKIHLFIWPTEIQN